MRLFEILTLTTLLVTFVGALVPKIKKIRWTAYLSVLTVLFILLHLFFEGYRWQMLFPYILTSLLFMGTVRTILFGVDKKRKSPSRFRKKLIIARIVLRFLMLATAITCVILSPKRQLQQPTEPGVGNTRIRPADGMVMVYVPAGEFKMGAPGLEWIRWPQSQRELKRMYYKPFMFTDEIPQHVVYLDAFWIDKTEVTVAMFRTFVDATGYITTAERQGWGTLRAMRGGAWYDTDVWVTCTIRHQNPSWDRYSDVGFRCAVPAKDNQH